MPKRLGLPISALKTPAASMPSLLRSAPAWSEIMKRPPPFCTKLRMAVISVDGERDVRLGHDEDVVVAEVLRVRAVAVADARADGKALDVEAFLHEIDAHRGVRAVPVGLRRRRRDARLVGRGEALRGAARVFIERPVGVAPAVWAWAASKRIVFCWAAELPATRSARVTRTTVKHLGFIIPPFMCTCLRMLTTQS